MILEPQTDVFRFELGKLRSVFAFVQLGADAFDEDVIGMGLDREPLLEFRHFGRRIDEYAVASRTIVVERGDLRRVHGHLRRRRLFAHQTGVVVVVAVVGTDRLGLLLVRERDVEGLQVVDVVVLVGLLRMRVVEIVGIVVVHVVGRVEFAFRRVVLDGRALRGNAMPLLTLERGTSVLEPVLDVVRLECFLALSTW